MSEVATCTDEELGERLDRLTEGLDRIKEQLLECLKMVQEAG